MITVDEDEDDLNPVEPPDVSGHIHVFTGNDDTDSDAHVLQNTGSNTSNHSADEAHVATGLSGRAKRKRKEAPISVAKSGKRQRQTSKSDGKKFEQHDKDGSVRSKWKNNNDELSPELPDSSPPVLADVHPELICKTPVELFEAMFDEEILDHIKQQFELYAKWDKNVPISTPLLIRFGSLLAYC